MATIASPRGSLVSSPVDSFFDGKTKQQVHITVVKDADRQRATELMTEQRIADGKEKKSKKSEPFTYKEANPVLARIIADSANPPSAGLVQALLEHGANVSIARPKSKSLFKKVIRKDQREVRSDLLSQATQNCGIEVVWILIQSADETAKNEALPIAIQKNDPAKAHILLESGADAAPLCTEFLSCVVSSADDMVEVLLRAENGPCQNCRDQGLVKAAGKGSARNTQILLDKGADADFQSGEALRTAIADGRDDLAIAIAACAKKASPVSFDLAVEVAYTKLSNDAEKQHRMIQTCLEGGSKGSKTDETLVQACKNGQSELIDLLLAHNVSVDHGLGAALQFAITSKQPELLQTLLRGKPTNTTMATVIPQAMTLDILETVHHIVDILLSAGLRGDSVAETLIRAIENGIPGGTSDGHLELIRLLLKKGEANINLQGGKSIRLAATQGWKAILALLLQHGPSVESLNAAFPRAMELPDPVVRLEIITMILEAGAKGAVVDEALVASANTGKDGVGLTSVILKQSSVDYDGGKPLVNAVTSRCLEQMKALMAGSPSKATLTAAWSEVDAIDDDGLQLQAFEVLLPGGVDASLQDKSLVAAAVKGRRGLPVSSLLLRNQASPERLEGSSVVAAAKGLHLDMLSLLAGYTTSAAAYLTAFDAFLDGEKWLTPRGLEIIHFLLEHGASGPDVDAAFCKAARLYEPDAVELLAGSINPGVLNPALAVVTNDGSDWLLPDSRNLWLIHSLLEWGAEGDAVNLAFLEAVNAYAEDRTSVDLVDTFMTVGAKADVNFQDAEALKIAIRKGKAPLLKRLISGGASKEAVSLAFAEAITTPLEEGVVLSLVNVLMKNEGPKPDVKALLDGDKPPIFMCLATHPESSKLVKYLAEVGCDLQATIETQLYDDEFVDPEPATALAWALCQPEMRISSQAIKALIDTKANVNFAAITSKATPLILASKYCRSDIVSKLIKAKADTSARDRFDRSALFYASRAGDLTSVNALIKAKSPINDGSLQEAAKRLHGEVVAALIKGKHSPDFPSSKEQHQGRTALQEMALMGDATRDATDLEATVSGLVKGKAKVLGRSRGKNALFLALDNAHPVPITRALLDIVMWKHVNDKDNIYMEVDPETGTKYFFSPTMYVAKGFSQGPEKDNEALLQLLHDKGCEDRFYAEAGAEQPEGAVGMPDKIVEAETKRKAHEEKLHKKEMEHQLKLLHEKQQAELKAEIERAKHEEKLFREGEAHQQKLLQEAQKAQQKQDIMASAGALKASMQQEADAAKARALEARAAFEEGQKVRMAQVKAAALEQEQELKMSFQRRANDQKLALQERQNRLVAAAADRKLITAKQMAATHVAEAQQKLAVKQKQDELALRLMRGTASHKQTLHGMQMRELQAKSETTKLKMLDKYFAGKQNVSLRKITAA
ncbi:hypothetical protein DL764_009908 [Monosporascus ibericus]|uniref:Uncharacterized protein n=1 Tax=Monosporascus ibericus TaxID=155417 RepID=A0A4Q4STS3_9PEZI|nr:hypothetical protein DL764_009908 [Monosporascus ibericus]